LKQDKFFEATGAVTNFVLTIKSNSQILIKLDQNIRYELWKSLRDIVNMQKLENSKKIQDNFKQASDSFTDTEQ
jgi:hypothetical protein